MLSEMTLAELLEHTAAGTPVPGGGSLAAMAAAVGAALSQMVAGLTAGRPQFESVTPQMTALAREAERLRAELLADMDHDARAYTAVMQAYRRPRQSGDEKARRAEAIQEAIRQATRVPLGVAEKALAVMHLAHTAVRDGNPNAASDAAVGAMLARAALRGALFNVRINLESVRDKAFADRMRAAVGTLETKAEALETTILSAIRF